MGLKEILTLMAMLELSGFHTVTGLAMGVNFYHKMMLVTPPFDSGAFEGPSDGLIRCHDTKTNCCTNLTKVDGFYNHQAYVSMMEAWESIVREEWGSVAARHFLTLPIVLFSV